MELVAPIDNTFGALLIGNYIGLVMYGTTAYQAYKYFQTYPKDTARLKCLVGSRASGAVTSGENIRPYSSFVLRVYKSPSYFYLVTNYFNPSALLAGSWSAILMGVVMCIIIFVAQVFYVRRIYLCEPQLSLFVTIPHHSSPPVNPNYRGLVVVLVVLLLGEVGAAAAAAIEGSTRYRVVAKADLTRMESIALVGVLAVDLFLASTLVILLHRTRTGFRNTDSLLNVLIAYTVNTCVLTSAINALALGFLIAFPTNMIYFGILTPATRSYTMAVLAVYVFPYSSS
ncbi:hypothetical protein DICSQDRAFT_168076 [Dichomitus squalens LYAD-421 SS1]|uniref:uncharacterized protein n=1 Tax=Dichomitus squalens (strain LYAD-421) TaxID=732165 RepID=UPI0004414B88|nr:uncharacterized protein DICSQDRAFT_168076 [Dichomitus squalens LYAD-421 SS1]EJF63195.1 hypothetical protein DICSQDRAFT_168076 [Dichomitus squalens LYAD-421 SS1]